MVSLEFSLTFTPPWRTSSPPVLVTTLSSVPQTLPTQCQMSTLETVATLSQHFLSVLITRGDCETLIDQDLFSPQLPLLKFLTNIHPDFLYSNISLVIYFSFC